jgi:hypothetical protein
MLNYKVILTIRVGSAIIVEAEDQATAVKMAILKYEAKLRERGTIGDTIDIRIDEIPETSSAK